jgi:O-antigen ligase
VHSFRTSLVPIYLSLCLLLGGASAGGIWANALLQLLALPLIASSILVTNSTPLPAPARQLIALGAMMVAVIALQLVPLPPFVWASLPGRTPIAEGFAAVGLEAPWIALSLTPYRTISSALWLLPAIAVLLAVLRLRAFKPTLIAWAITSVAIVSVVIGGLQVAGGESWYFYQVTNLGASVGFFANANHLATLLVCTLPFLTALYLRARARGHSVQRNSGLVMLLVGAVFVVFVGLAVNRSIAGAGLSLAVLAASALMIRSERKRKVPMWLVALVPVLVIGGLAAVALSGPMGNSIIGAEARASGQTRSASFAKSLDAAAEYFPAGSGIGSFQEVYRSHEDPHTIERVFMNHVHSDYIELLLETGAPGMLVLFLFLLWWMQRAAALWRAKDRDYFALAGSISSAAILAHSFVDYPLRTAAIGAVFALSVALMAEPRPAGRGRSEGGESGKLQARHLTAD